VRRWTKHERAQGGHVNVRGKAGELELLYEERFADFVRVATAITGRESSALDVVQETFVRALVSLDSFRGEGPLAGWVWRILVNTARSDRSSPWRESAEELDLLASTPGTNGHVADDLGVRRWVAALPERQRLAVFLRYFADLDYAAIAAALEIEVGTVSATLNAAHRTLRRMLEEVAR
jgi:RNA polymerase sigma factor (sigma-70 family)